MTSDETQLPRGWAETTLEAVCRILDSRRIPVNKSERSRRIEGRDEDELYPYYGATGKVGEIDDFIFEGEHVLVGEDGAPFLDFSKSKAYLVRGKFWVNNHAHIVKASVSNAFVCHYLNQIDYSVHVTGTTRLKLTQDALRRLPLRVAPANEQRRIVAKIEELFSELDKGIESLKTARRRLEVYRQSVLKHAFEGKLTAQWREENKDKLETPERLLARVKKERVARYERELQSWGDAVKASKYSDKLSKKPAGPKKPEDVTEVSEDETAKLTSLPEGWLWIRVGSLLSERPANGRSVKDRLSGFPVLRLTAIKQEKLDLSEVKSGDWEREDALPYLIHEGDFLVARGNGSKGLVGRGALVPAVENDVAYPDTMIRLRVTPEAVDESFFSYVWNSHVLRRQIEGAARTTAGIYKINQGHILDFLIPLCSKGEQTVVVNQLSEILTAIDELEAEVDEQVCKFGPLRQAILKKAFAGQLVTQDPSDEPVSVLLEKIRTERAKAGPTVRKNRKAKTAA